MYLDLRLSALPQGAAVSREPELASIEAFAEYLIDDDRTTFTLADCQALGVSIRLSNQKIRLALESYGFKFIPPEHGRTVRGFTSNSHDRWYGPGSAATHGGSGQTNIAGFAGDPARSY